MATKERAGGRAVSVPTPGHRQSVPTGLHGHGRGGGGIPPGAVLSGAEIFGFIPLRGGRGGGGRVGDPALHLAGACLGVGVLLNFSIGNSRPKTFTN